MKHVLLAFCLNLGMSCHAQIKFDVKVSDKHLEKVERSKDARSKLKSYKAYYQKDSIRAAKKAWKQYKRHHKDSLKATGKWQDIRMNRLAFMSGKWSFTSSESHRVDTTLFQPPRDSMDWALQELARRGEFGKLQQVYESYGQYDSAYLDQFRLDSMKLDSGTLISRFDMKKRLESYLPPELAAESNTRIDQQLRNGMLDEYGNIQKIDRSGVSEFFKNISPEEFARSQVSMAIAKKKYETIPDLSKKEEGVRKNSQEGTPLKKRLFLNGNITIQSTDPVILDTNIQLGYKWTKSFSTGIGLVLREQLNGREAESITGDAHGFSFFTSCDIPRGFFVYGEYQAVKNTSLFSESRKPVSWQYAAMLGVGRKFAISQKINISIMLLYDFNYRHNTLNQRPLVPRIGYSIGF